MWHPARKFLLLALLLCFAPLKAQAQSGFIQVSGTIVDPQGFPYAGGSTTGATISAILVPSGGTSPTLHGKTFATSVGPIALNNDGSFTIALADNTVVLPSGTEWQFTVVGTSGLPWPIGRGSQAFQVTLQIHGNGLVQDISTQLSAAAPSLTNVCANSNLPAATGCASGTGITGSVTNPFVPFADAPNDLADTGWEYGVDSAQSLSCSGGLSGTCEVNIAGGSLSFYKSILGSTALCFNEGGGGQPICVTGNNDFSLGLGPDAKVDSSGNLTATTDTFPLIAAPANPSSGNGIVWIDSTADTLECKLSSGVSCLPPFAPSQKIIYATDPKYGLFADTQVVTTGNSWTGTTTITCTTCNFSSATDPGKHIFGTAGSFSGTVLGFALTLPETTIASVTDSSHVVVASAAGSSSTSNGTLAWGHPDDTALSLIDADWQNDATCSAVMFPSGNLWWEAVHFITLPTRCLNGFANTSIFYTLSQGPTLEGQGMAQTYHIISPNFAWAGCTVGNASNGCTGGLFGETMQDMSFTGLGNNFSGVTISHTFLSLGGTFTLRNVGLLNFGQQASGRFVCVSDNGQGNSVARLYHNDLDACGNHVATPTQGTMLELTGAGAELYDGNVVQNGDNNIIYIGANSLLTSHGTLCAPGLNDSQFPICFRYAGTYNAIGDIAYTNGATSSNFKGLEADAGGVGHVSQGNYGCTLCGGGGSNPANNNYIHGGQLYADNTKFWGGPSAGPLFGDSGGQFFDQGGNTCLNESGSPTACSPVSPPIAAVGGYIAGFATLTVPAFASSSSVPVCSNSGTLSTCNSTGTGSLVQATSPTLTTPNLGTPSAINLANATFPAGFNAVLTGTTGSIGGSALLAGQCSAGTATVTGATTAMVATTSPSSDPDSSLSTGVGIYAFVSGSNTVTVRVCAIVAVTPAATTYNVRVLQ